MSDEETERLAKSNAVAGLCPITEANLGDGIFNASNYIQHAGRFGIGSDSNVLISLTEELRTLEYSQRLLRQQRLVMTNDEIQSNGSYLYSAAASGGAQALGRKSGSLAVGQLADLVALDGEHVALQGKHCEQLLDAWIFAARNSAITDVWSAGRHRVRDGHHVAREDIEQKFVNVLQRLQSKL
jgi:formiminoglutamate deiminase